MDVTTAMEPLLQVSPFFGLSTFDKTLRRTTKIRVLGWSIFLFNLLLQFSNFYYYMRIDLKGDLNQMISKRPHDSTLIALNCFCTTLIILAYDGIICNSLIKMREFNRKRFPLDQKSVQRVKNISKLLRNCCFLFCVLFIGINAIWCWYANISENLDEYILYCVGIFLRYSIYGNLSNQVVSYYMVIWMWYYTINKRLKQIKGWSSKNDQKVEIVVLMKADELIKDFNRDVSFVYSVFILMSCAAALVGCTHSVVFLVYTSIIQVYEAIFAVFFVSSLVTQIGLFAGIYGSIARKVEKTAQQVQDLFVDSIELKEEVEIFSLQLLHQNIELTACGFFTLDFSLLHKMAGAVMTYVVIVIQLKSVSTPKISCTVGNCTDL